MQVCERGPICGRSPKLHSPFKAWLVTGEPLEDERQAIMAEDAISYELNNGTVLNNDVAEDPDHQSNYSD